MHSNLEGEFVAVLLNEADGESIVTGVICPESDPDYLTLAYYLHDTGDGVKSKEMTFRKDLIQTIKIWQRKEIVNVEATEVEPKQLELQLIGGDQITEGGLIDTPAA